ncbi:MAG: hypothetical protein WCO89_04940 [Syntrophus sp. (in: bacteria)]
MPPNGNIMIENIDHDGRILAVLLHAGYREEGVKFFSPGDFSQQLGYMNRPTGYVIPPHMHNLVQREVHYTKEVLFIKSGSVRVDFYDDDQNYLESRVLHTGDVILLAFGGHGFEMVEPTEIIEVKQGPYVGEMDKTRFAPIAAERVVIKNDNSNK